MKTLSGLRQDRNELEKLVCAMEIGYAFMHFQSHFDTERLHEVIQSWEKRYNEPWFSYYLRTVNAETGLMVDGEVYRE